MKKYLFLFFIILSIATQVKTQVRVYASGGPEIIFSVAEIEDQFKNGNNILRFAPWYNIQINGNVDIGRHFGFLFGGAIRNVGLIYEYPDTEPESNATIKKKYRNYNFGLPVGIKLGLMNSWLFYGGYEIDFPFSYKEKTFINDVKQESKITTWFSSRVPSYYHSVFVGIQFPYGFSLKFKYYLSEFFNQNYTAADGSQPYLGLKSNIWYFSLNFGIFRNTKAYYKQKNKTKDQKDYY